ncbi:SH3 domain-containing protein [Pulveribacter sp.]|uniref:SH3 domain-containing protein n=1 Tax=Pulveribacter sp. TaxID=2678893 RepID=UPI003918324B
MSFDLPRFASALRTAAAALALAAPLLAPAGAQAREFVSIKGNVVNVREKPTTRSDTLWELSSGYPLQVRERRGQWLRVRDYEATLGWVFAPLTTKTPHRVVTARTANLRAKPGTNSRVVGKLEQNEIVRTLESQGTWTKVRRGGGQTGWVAKRLTWGW